MSPGEKVVIELFIAGVIVAVVAGELLFLWMLTFYAGNPGVSDAYFNAPFLGTGIGAGFFSIAMVLYPIRKKTVKNFEGEDFR